MNGLIIVDASIRVTGYFYDYDRMDEFALRDEYITFVKFWEAMMIRRWNTRDTSPFPTVTDVYNLGLRIKKVCEYKNCLNDDFMDRLKYMEMIYKVTT